MKIVPFDSLYYTDFFISEAFSKYQSWHDRGDVYNALNKPKPSHTLLWFKNVSGTIVCPDGSNIPAPKNSLFYMSKGIEYLIRFHGTAPGQIDTVVIHFQMQDENREDIAPTLLPEEVIENVDAPCARSIEQLAEEFRKNIVCIPETNAVIYQIIATVCKARRADTTQDRFACIQKGIEMLENDVDLTIREIADACLVSECYFRRLFKEYSGQSPSAFRQQHRIDRARVLLLSHDLSVSEIASELHFSDIYHFSKVFKRFTGLSPLAFAKKNE